jgi:D-serine deaminase-like pyridoxal phosphate-dependent protein
MDKELEILSEIETPNVIVDKHRLLSNIMWIQEKANRNHVSLRPHIKVCSRTPVYLTIWLIRHTNAWK